MYTVILFCKHFSDIICNISLKYNDFSEKSAVPVVKASVQAEGEKVIPVLFEEMDGVWLNIQDEHHKKMKKQEMKVFTMYEG